MASVGMIVRDIGFRLGYDIDKQSEQAAERSIVGLKNTATKMLGAIGIGLSLIQINAVIEQFGAVNNGIRTIVNSMEEAEEAQLAILKAANGCRTTYAEMATNVQNLSKAAGNLFNVDEAAEYASNVTKLLKSAGRSDSVVVGVLEALNKSFQKGEIDSETLNRMLETAPETADMLAKSIGRAKSELLSMASAKELKVEDLKNAFLKSADEINKAYANVDMTISDALKNARNSWGLWLAQIDKTLGITNLLARAIIKLSDTAMIVAQKVRTQVQRITNVLGGTEKMMRLIAIGASAVIVAMRGPKVLQFLRTVNVTLTAINLKVMAIIGSFVAVGLILEDLYAFVKGENSLTGLILGKAGVDIEAFRKTCQDLWDILSELGSIAIDLGKSIGGQLLESVKTLMPLLSTLVSAILPILLVSVKAFAEVFGAVVKLVKILLPPFMEIVNTILPVFVELIVAIIEPLTEIVSTLLPALMGLFEAIAPIIEAVVGFFATLVKSLLPLFVSLLQAISPALKPVLDVLKKVADVLNSIVQSVGKIVEAGAAGVGSVLDKVFGNDENHGGGGNRYKFAYAGGTDYSADTFVAGEEGPEIVTGNAGKKVFTALETGDILRNLMLFSRSLSAKPATVTNANTSKVVNQYNSFSNTFYGDRAGQAKSESAMSKASDNAVDAMARALSFAR